MPQPDQPTPETDRRAGARPPPARFGELVVEPAWRPADRPADQPLPWRIAHGYAPERRFGSGQDQGRGGPSGR